MPVSERLSSKRAIPGVRDGFSMTLMGWPMAGGMISVPFPATGNPTTRTLAQRSVMATETIEVSGHIVDSLLLAKILDTILDAGCDYEIAEFRIGKTSLDTSQARIEVSGADDVLGPLLDHLPSHSP